MPVPYAPRHRLNASHAAAAFFCLLAIAGCGGGPFDIVPVSGSVAYEDGEPLPIGNFEIKFVPQVESPDGAQFPRVGTAIVNAEGQFSAATTHKYRDGLINGRHKVYFKSANGPGGKPVVAAEFLSSQATPLVVDVAESRALEIRVPRPSG